MGRVLLILSLAAAGCLRPLSDCEGSRTIDSPREMLRFSRERCRSVSGELVFAPRAGDEGGVHIVFEDLESVGSLTLSPDADFWAGLTVSFPKLSGVETVLTVDDAPNAEMEYRFPELTSVGALTGPQMGSFLEFPVLEEADELRGVFDALELPALRRVDQVDLRVGLLALPLLEQAEDITLESQEPVELPELHTVRSVEAHTPRLHLRELESIEVLRVNAVKADVLTSVDELVLTIDGGLIELGSLRTAPSIDLAFERLSPVTLPSWTGGDVRLGGRGLGDLYAPAMTEGTVVATIDVNRLRLPALAHASLIQVAMRGPLNLGALTTADVVEISNTTYPIELPELRSVSERLWLRTSGEHDQELPALVDVPELSIETLTSARAPVLGAVADLTATAGDSGILSFPALTGSVSVVLTGAGALDLGSTAAVTSAELHGGTWTGAVIPWGSVVDVVELRGTSAQAVHLGGVTALGSLVVVDNAQLSTIGAADLQTADRVWLSGDGLLTVDAPVLSAITVELMLEASSLDGCDAEALVAAAESGGATVVVSGPPVCPVSR